MTLTVSTVPGKITSPGRKYIVADILSRYPEDGGNKSGKAKEDGFEINNIQFHISKEH